MSPFLDKQIKHKNIFNYIKAQRLSWFGHVKTMPDTRTVKKIINWKPLTKISQGRPKYRWEDNIKQDHNIIPRFLQFHHHFHSRAANRIYQRTSFALLRERIHNNRRELDHTSRALLLFVHTRTPGKNPEDNLSSNRIFTNWKSKTG